MNNNAIETPKPPRLLECPGRTRPPFSPLGWPVWQRLAVAGGCLALLWAVVLWALD